MQNTIRDQLMKLQDTKYREFHRRLIPTIEPERIIGIRVPVLRTYAKQIRGTEAAERFLTELPHWYYEENNLHMMLITSIPEYDRCLKEIRRFLPYVDNWATCDLPEPKCFSKNKERLFLELQSWILSAEPYTKRYGIGMLMRLYLDEDFRPEYPELVAGISSEEYYVNMMIAWYFATALAKQWKVILPYIENRRLSEWAHRKTIQKAIESNRITDEQKQYLRTLR